LSCLPPGPAAFEHFTTRHTPFQADSKAFPARPLPARYAEVTLASAPPLSIARPHRCQAITGENEASTEEAFEAALAAHVEAEDPFEAARTRLLYGGRLRRAGQRIAARTQLSAAHDAFDSMDLTRRATVAGGLVGAGLS
jgi:hypothetical protein